MVPQTNPMPLPIGCTCGSLRGTVGRGGPVNRALCYCTDCQAFARYLGRDAEILDAQGGTDVVQVLPRYVSFTQGIDKLACVRLTAQGLLRWYASCCRTPIGNMLPNFKVSFVGLIHNCLEHGGRSLDDSFGPVRMRVHTRHARGATVRPLRLKSGTLRVAGMVLKARLDGSYRTTPFFDMTTGAPVVTPSVLSAAQLQELKRANGRTDR